MRPPRDLLVEGAAIVTGCELLFSGDTVPLGREKVWKRGKKNKMEDTFSPFLGKDYLSTS